ncbi:ribosome-inactivating family protein [Streptomyces sp. NPDC001833]|uniref:ribosome-inactivating family protein n=1 Tax=Streptomyces sp. NPDC001833 TaxID=3154658 RepID=UPI00331B099A
MRTTRLFRRIGVPAALSAALVGAVALHGQAASPASAGTESSAALAPGKIDLAAFYQVPWKLDHGPDGATNYQVMISNVRAEARDKAGATRSRIVASDDQQHAVDTTDARRTQEFADVVITATTGGSVHAVVRLSDMYVVQFYFVRGDGRAVAYNLAQDVPTSSSTLVAGTFPEGYDALARLAGRSLTGIPLGTDPFDNAVGVLRNPSDHGRDEQARAMLSFIVAISEGTRFGPISTNIFRTTRNFQQYALTDQDVNTMRSWSRVSSIYRNNGGASVTLYGQVINGARTAASLLLTALGGQSGVPNDEL